MRETSFNIKTDEDIMKLNQMKCAVKMWIVKGYSVRGLRAYLDNKHL
jgi:hypothetical protein